MPSFDVVSEVNFQEVDNAVNQVHKEISQRFDFKGGRSEIKLDKTTEKLTIIADDELKLRAIHQILQTKMAKREVSLKCLKYGEEQQVSGGLIKQEIDLKAGLDKEKAKKINIAIKNSKLKVTSQSQDAQVRVTGKSIDDLQSVQSLLKNGDFDFDMQFINQRK